jgi:Arc/MetJ family transcription regulator
VIRRTTIEIDAALLDRARSALRTTTMRATVEEALRRAADDAETQVERLAEAQREHFRRLKDHLDLDVHRSDEMWR